MNKKIFNLVWNSNQITYLYNFIQFNTDKNTAIYGVNILAYIVEWILPFH